MSRDLALIIIIDQHCPTLYKGWLTSESAKQTHSSSAEPELIVDDSAKKSLLVIFSCFPKLSAYRLIRDSILEKRCKCSVRWWPPHPRADLRGILGSLRGCTEAPSAGQQPPPQIGWTGHWSVYTLLFCYFFHLKILACTYMSDQNRIPLTFLVPRLDKSKLLLDRR